MKRMKGKAHFYKQRRLFSDVVDELQLGEGLDKDKEAKMETETGRGHPGIFK